MRTQRYGACEVDKDRFCFEVFTEQKIFTLESKTNTKQAFTIKTLTLIKLLKTAWTTISVDFSQIKPQLIYDCFVDEPYKNMKSAANKYMKHLVSHLDLQSFVLPSHE